MHVLDEFLIRLKRKAQTWNLLTLCLLKTYKSWDKLLGLLFRYHTRCYARQSPVQIEKLKNPYFGFKYFSDHFGRFSGAKTLIGKVTDSEEDLRATQYLLELIYLHIKSPKLVRLITAEILCKVLAYRNMKEGVVIYIPIVTKNETIEYIPFTIDTIFDLWKKHVAFGLCPHNHEEALPILLYRGTDLSVLTESGRASLISDLDPEGPGKRLFHNSRADIRRWLMQLSQQGKKISVMGHSLGGVMAIYTALYEHSFLSKDPNNPSYAFNPPGLAFDLTEEWSMIPLEERPAFMNLITRGDIISKFGYLVGDNYEMCTNKPLSPFLAHEQLIFSQPISYLTKIDTSIENLSSSRKYYSKIQTQSTSLAYLFGLKYLFPNPS